MPSLFVTMMARSVPRPRLNSRAHSQFRNLGIGFFDGVLKNSVL